MKLLNEHNIPAQVFDMIQSVVNPKDSVYRRQSYYARLKDTKIAIDAAINLYETELKKAERR
jgi:hypothetical protein